MIRIGLSNEQKETEIQEYLRQHSMRKVFVLYYKAFRPLFESIDIDVEYVEYGDIIEYNYFYRLLEEIHDDCLIVVDECMRTQNRSELTYNCAHHYLNQTPHKIIFEWFPFIEDQDDFLILLDFQNKSKYRGKGFHASYLGEEDILLRPNPIEFEVETLPVTGKQRLAYQKKKQQLFDGLGNKDPDTIPRNLHVFVGNWKRAGIDPFKNYVARNARFKLPNVATYRERAEGERIVIDFPHRRLDFNDYLKITKPQEVTFLSTGLPVDNYYASELRNWLERVGEFIAQASIYH